MGIFIIVVMIMHSNIFIEGPSREEMRSYYAEKIKYDFGNYYVDVKL